MPSSPGQPPPRGPKAEPAPAPTSSTASVADDEEPRYQRPDVRTQVENFTLKQIINEIQLGEINLEPEYQRDFVWDAKTCSGFVRTVYKGLETPPLTFHRREDPQRGVVRDVVDGKQRLATLYTFMTGDPGRFPKAPTVLDLKDDDMSEFLDGRTFAQLSAFDQSFMKNVSFTVRTIPASATLDYVYDVYESMNTGGVGHSAQQIRRAAFHGAYIRLLSRLGRHETFRLLADLSEAEERELHGEELVLRFFALYRAAVPALKRPYRTPMKRFLNEELQAADPAGSGRRVVLQLSEAEERDKEEAFRATVEVCADLDFKRLAEEALRGAGGGRGKSFRRGGGGATNVLWDVTLVGLRLALDDGVKPLEFKRRKAALQAGFRQLLEDRRWAEAPATLSQKSLWLRLELFRELVVGAAPLAKAATQAAQGPRLFAASVRDALFARQSSPGGGIGGGAAGGGVRCAWCGEPIVHVKDAEVDHVVPYAQGGTTTYDNAQLLHALCNRERGQKPMSAAPARAAAAAAPVAGRELGTGASQDVSDPGRLDEGGGRCCRHPAWARMLHIALAA
ncbi:hypothetical protein HYH02_008020 [Chlamydomonas schloesseri]|uniref:HNH nuclease domain-containing protein n=1 Tax=Chlamydomonas schloesseri TaxID=2026947 RepID=A0A835WG49_9CHLO|nr:hypothetical protein HYH02_008020 [Chlamydomonas schloesseri]|eukprot:KAG2446863.1 hypothetical protein HYH02_008020 [Chlamydomonas schloesseri]